MSAATFTPSWLVPPQAASPQPTPAPQPAMRHTSETGFSVPRQWPNDGGARREPVLDLGCSPPRIIRRVGWRRCLRCEKPFFSDDVVRVRLCSGEVCRDR